MRIAVIGGGPGGLYFAALTKALRPESEIRVWERNAPDDTFGFGVVFTDETLGGIEHADPVIHARMAERFARWDDIDVHFRGTVTTVGGHGFAAMSRKDLLRILQERCARARRPTSTSAPRHRTSTRWPRDARPGDRRRRARTPRCAPSTPTSSARPSTCAGTSTCGSAPTWCSTRSSSTSARPRTA